jgi:hypothetical protein
VGTARHRGRLAWDDPPLIDRPVLPFGSFNILTRRSKLRRVSRFSGASPRQAGSTHPEAPISAVARFLRNSARGPRPESRFPCAPLRPRPREASDSGSPGAPSSPTPERVLDSGPPTASSSGPREGLRSTRSGTPTSLPSHPSCGSSPGSSYSLAPIRFGLSACADRPPPVGQSVVRTGVTPSCRRHKTRSRGISEFTGLSTNKPRNPQETLRSSTVNTQVAHRLRSVHAQPSPGFWVLGSSGAARTETRRPGHPDRAGRPVGPILGVRGTWVLAAGEPPRLWHPDRAGRPVGPILGVRGTWVLAAGEPPRLWHPDRARQPVGPILGVPGAWVLRARSPFGRGTQKPGARTAAKFWVLRVDVAGHGRQNACCDRLRHRRLPHHHHSVAHVSPTCASSRPCGRLFCCSEHAHHPSGVER